MPGVSHLQPNFASCRLLPGFSHCLCQGVWACHRGRHKKACVCLSCLYVGVCACVLHVGKCVCVSACLPVSLGVCAYVGAAVVCMCMHMWTWGPSPGNCDPSWSVTHLGVYTRGLRAWEMASQLLFSALTVAADLAFVSLFPLRNDLGPT